MQHAARTGGYYFLFLCLGLDMALLGPTLPSLAGQTGSTLAILATVVMLGSIGYTVGTLAGGWIFDRVPGHLALGVAQVVTACLIALVPAARTPVVLGTILLAKSSCMGLINTGANALLVWTHGEKTGPYMNGLHFSFGLGAFLSPLFAGLFLSGGVGYAWNYRVVAAIALLSGVAMFLIPKAAIPAHRNDHEDGAGPKAAFPFALVASAMLYLFFYVGAEISFGNWIFTYSTKRGILDAAGAAFLNSGFWLSFTFGRLASIWVATRIPARKVIPIGLSGALLCILSLMLFPASSGLAWVVSLGLGFFLAPLWPTGFTFASQTMKLTARVSSLILLGDSLGGMLLPWVVGQVIEGIGPGAMAWLVFGSLSLNFAAYAWMLKARPREPGGSPSRPSRT